MKKNVYYILSGFCILLCCSGGSVQAAGDCSTALTADAFATSAIEIIKGNNPDGSDDGIDSNNRDLIYFTQEQLEFVAKGLNTFCCTDELLSKGICDDKKLLTQNVYQSPFMFDQIKLLLNVQSGGKENIAAGGDLSPKQTTCSQYGIGCAPHIYATNDLPSPLVCARNGANVADGGDERCDSVFDVGSGVDTLANSTDISSSSQYLGIFKNFRVNESQMIPLRWDAVTSDSIKDLTFMQLGRLMCEEVEILHNVALSQGISLEDKTLYAQGGGIKKLCQNMVLDLFVSNSAYIKASSYVAMQHQSKKTNTAIRGYMYDVLYHFLGSVGELIAGGSQMFNEMGSEYTNVCSV